MADLSHPGTRLAILRRLLRLSQGKLAAAMDLAGQGTVSDWENGKAVPSKGALRLAADLCANDREVYAWLVTGEGFPEVVPLVNGVPVDQGWDAERRELATALRRLADRLAPLETSPTPIASDPAGRAAQAAASATPGAPGAQGRPAKGASTGRR